MKNFKRTKNLLLVLSAIVAPLALEVAYVTANSTCFFLSYQPDEPKCLQELMSLRK